MRFNARFLLFFLVPYVAANAAIIGYVFGLEGLLRTPLWFKLPLLILFMSTFIGEIISIRLRKWLRSRKAGGRGDQESLD